MADIIECRCGRRHQLGTEWCPCGVYLPHDGQVIDGSLDDRSPDGDGAAETTVGGSRVAIVPDTSFEPDVAAGVEAGPEVLDQSQGLEPMPAAQAMVASGGTSSPVQQAYEPTVQNDRGDDEAGFDDHVPRADDQICPDDTCHTRNPASLVFCRRCGTTLARLSDAEIDAKFSWWDRQKARLTGRDLRQSAMQAKYQVRRAKGLSTRARMFRTALLGGAVGVAGLGLSPAIRGQVTDRAKDLTFADRYSFVEVESVTTASSVDTGWEPELVLDGTYNRAWGTTWPFDNEGIGSIVEGLECVASDELGGPTELAYPRLRFVLTESESIDRLRIWAGTWEQDEGRELRPRPRVLEIRALTDEGPADCVFIELEDDPEPQAIELDLPNASAVDISVVGIYGGEDTSRRLAISELWLERQR